MSAARSQAPSADSSPPARWTRPEPVTAAIVILTALAVALRLYQLSRPDYLIGVTEYDDGTDFGSAILLIHGDLPYRDFIMVQPPGITLLMAPVALVTKGLGTAWGMGVGRILTALAGAAAVTMGGLLVRHRGLLAVLVTGGILAVYPPAVQAAHTVLLEPWVVLFCLAGLLAVFDGDRLASTRTRRLVWGGVAFGFAGAIKVWAILPVLVILVLILAGRQPRRAAAYAAGVVAGFAVPVLPFAALAPATFYRSVVVAQLRPGRQRPDPARLPAAPDDRPDRHHRADLHAGAVPDLAAHRGPGRGVLRGRVAADRGAAATAGAVRAGGLRADHRLVPVACRLLLPLRRLPGPVPGSGHRAAGGPVRGCPPRGPRRPRRHRADGRCRGHRGGPPPRGRLVVRYATPVAIVAVLVMTVAQFGFEASLQPPLAPTTPGLTSDVISAASKVIPPGACVLTDQASYTIAASRFFSARPGCVPMVDGVGSDYSLSRGRSAATGAQRVAAVARCGCRRCAAPSTSGCHRCPSSASPGPPGTSRSTSTATSCPFRTARSASTCAGANPYADVIVVRSAPRRGTTHHDNGERAAQPLASRGRS